MNSFTSLAGIQDEPSRALMSPGSRSAGWTAFSASTLRGIDRIERRRGFGGLELRPHVAAQIAVGGLPFAFGVAVDQAVEFALQSAWALRPVSCSMRGQSMPPVSFSEMASASAAVSTWSAGLYRSSVRRSKMAVLVARLVSAS